MRYELSTPTPDQLGAVVEDLASWQQDGLPVQLHSGDLGWHWRFGASKLAEALRVWTVDDTTLAIGFLDKSSLIRMAIAPAADDDEELAALLVHDLEDPTAGVLDAGQAHGRGPLRRGVPIAAALPGLGRRRVLVTVGP